MSVKLRVIHGALKKNDRFQVVIPITKTPFTIGRASDCDMRCHSTAISRRHCEIRVAGFDVTIVDLNSRNGVCVNGEFVTDAFRLKNGDRLAIGRLQFELIIEFPRPRAGHDPLGDSVCEMLLEADRSEAGERSSDSQWYKIETVDPYEGMSAKEKLEAKAACVIVKLPPIEYIRPTYSYEGTYAFINVFSAAAARGVENATIRAMNAIKVCPSCNVKHDPTGHCDPNKAAAPAPAAAAPAAPAPAAAAAPANP